MSAPTRQILPDQARLENGWGQRKPWTIGRPAFVSELIRLAAAEHLTTPAMVIGKSRQRNVCNARWQVIRAVAADPRRFSLPEIGKWMGGMHHTAVLNAIRKGEPYASTAPPVPPQPEPYDPDVPDESGVWI